MARSDRAYDLVLFGATGFVGRLTAEHLVRSAPADARIAFAGRSQERLAALTADLGVDWPTLVVDSSDEAGVAVLARQTAVVASTVGPYLKHGLPLVAACARAGTSYADLTGESAFAAHSIRDNHAIAQESGARIVHSCGFDSIPSDLGVGLAHAAAGGEPIVEALVQVRSIRGGVSGGTIDSLRGQLLEAGDDPALRRLIADPYALTPGPTVRLPREPAPRRRRDPASGRWQAPFVMGAYNQQVVQRSNHLTGWSYGQLLRYREVVDTMRGVRGRMLSAAVDALPAVLAGGMAFPPTRAVLDRVLPAPGEGPSEEAMRDGRFAIDVDVYPVTGAPVRARVAAPYDPGYRGTAVMLGESVLCLALDDALPDRAGVLTPMTAMGEALAARLRAHRFTLETAPLR